MVVRLQRFYLEPTYFPDPDPDPSCKMTEATLTHPAVYLYIAPRFTTRLQCPSQSHLFEVMLHLKSYSLPVLDLKLPVWTPGSYLSGNTPSTSKIFSPSRRTVFWRMQAKNHCKLKHLQVVPLRLVRYRVFAHELSVRTNHWMPRTAISTARLCFLEYLRWYVNRFALLLCRRELGASLPLTSSSRAQHFPSPDFDTL